MENTKSLNNASQSTDFAGEMVEKITSATIASLIENDGIMANTSFALDKNNKKQGDILSLLSHGTQQRRNEVSFQAYRHGVSNGRYIPFVQGVINCGLVKPAQMTALISFIGVSPSKKMSMTETVLFLENVIRLVDTNQNGLVAGKQPKPLTGKKLEWFSFVNEVYEVLRNKMAISE